MKLHLLIAAAAAVLIGSATAQAEYPNGCFGGPWYYDHDYIVHARDRVPHFALFPPVYYSYPVPRPYGYSPFAYPPGVMTPEILSRGEPANIENPHVPKAEEKTQATSNKTAEVRSSSGTVAQVVINPYVELKVAGE